MGSKLKPVPEKVPQKVFDDAVVVEPKPEKLPDKTVADAGPQGWHKVEPTSETAPGIKVEDITKTVPEKSPEKVPGKTPKQRVREEPVPPVTEETKPSAELPEKVPKRQTEVPIMQTKSPEKVPEAKAKPEREEILRKGTQSSATLFLMHRTTQHGPYFLHFLC